jgi:hypothetical protein
LWFLAFNSFCAWLDWRNEFAGGEIIEGAEAAGELVGAQAALAVERAHKFHGVALGLQGVAIQTARDEVAVGIAAEVGLRNDVVEAPSVVGDPPRTIEAAAALAFVDGRVSRTPPLRVGILNFPP